jgi:hypothetical protein
MKPTYVFLGVLAAIGASGAWADAELIRIQQQDCSITQVADDEPRPDCPTDAACRHRGERVKWVVTPSVPFSVAFPGGSPFASDSCLSGAGICVISDQAYGEYAYAVTLTGCASMDPKIIVR